MPFFSDKPGRLGRTKLLMIRMKPWSSSFFFFQNAMVNKKGQKSSKLTRYGRLKCRFRHGWLSEIPFFKNKSASSLVVSPFGSHNFAQKK